MTVFYTEQCERTYVVIATHAPSCCSQLSIIIFQAEKQKQFATRVSLVYIAHQIGKA